MHVSVEFWIRYVFEAPVDYGRVLEPESCGKSMIGFYHKKDLRHSTAQPSHSELNLPMMSSNGYSQVSDT